MSLDPYSPGGHTCARPPVDIEIRLEPTLQAPGIARRFVARELTTLGYPQLVEDARIAVSELVTNAITYVPGKPLWVDIRRAGKYAVLEVWDCSPEPPVAQDPDFLAQSGRGLQVIDQLGVRSGYETFCCGKVVWIFLGPKDQRPETQNKGEGMESNAASSRAQQP